MTTNQEVTYQRAYEALLEKHGNDRAIINMMFRDGQKQFDKVLELEGAVQDAQEQFTRAQTLQRDLNLLQLSWDQLDNELGETVEALIKSNRELDTCRTKVVLLKGKLAEYEAMDHLGEEPF